MNRRRLLVHQYTVNWQMYFRQKMFTLSSSSSSSSCMLRLFDPYLFGESSVWRFFLIRTFIYIGFVTDRKGFPCTALVLLVRTVNSLRVTFRILYLKYLTMEAL